MLNHTSVISLLALILLAISSTSCSASESGEKPDLRQLSETISKTREKVSKSMASWRLVFELPGKFEVHVKVDSAQEMTRCRITVVNQEKQQQWIDVIMRDGAWYVDDGRQAGKYRPFEAPAESPQIYSFLEKTRPKFADLALLESTATFESVEENVATYRTPLTEPMKRQLTDTVSQMTELFQQAEKEKHELSNKQGLMQLKQTLEDILQKGMCIKVDLETGLIVQSGIFGRRCWVRDFKLDDEVDSRIFDIDSRQWPDHTQPMKGTGTSDLIAIQHAGSWKPGSKAEDTDPSLLNYKTGEIRRVPYQGSECMPICFSRDRKRVYVGGLISETASMGLFEINLVNLSQKQLGMPLLDRGLVLAGDLSPDGKKLAVVQGMVNRSPLQNQFVLVDLESNKTGLLGKPLDGAYLSWLPDGSGLIFVSHKWIQYDQPAECTICKMDLQGNITTLLKGDSPLVLPTKQQILYENDDRQWWTYDLESKKTKLFFEGLKGYAFPALSPDGKQLIMMKINKGISSNPHLVDVTTGEITPLPVKSGLWTLPVWK